MKKSHVGRQAILLKAAILVCLLVLMGPVIAGVVSSADTAPDTASTSRSLPLLVDVGADKCIPCVMMAPILEDLRREYTGVLNVEFVDAWKKPEEARKYRVRGIPTQIFYDASGKELGRHMGFISKEDILRGFAEYGILLKNPSGK